MRASSYVAVYRGGGGAEDTRRWATPPPPSPRYQATVTKTCPSPHADIHSRAYITGGHWAAVECGRHRTSPCTGGVDTQPCKLDTQPCKSDPPCSRTCAHAGGGNPLEHAIASPKQQITASPMAAPPSTPPSAPPPTAPTSAPFLAGVAPVADPLRPRLSLLLRTTGAHPLPNPLSTYNQTVHENSRGRSRHAES